MNFTELVETKKREARIANIDEVRREIDKPWVQKKIANHVAAFDGIMSAEEVREAILTSVIVASKFCKDPGKQNISEKLAAEVLGLPKLPASGRNSIRFTDSGDIVSTAAGNTKSADFIWNGYYTTQKYTDCEGGAQDNQRNDVIDFLKRGSIKHKVAAIVDGAYWDKYRPQLMQEFMNNPNVLITSVTEITES
jgi:hypothetical protein